MSVTKELILTYQGASDTLKKAKALELKLRNEIIKSFRYKKFEGVENKEFTSDDLNVKISVGLKLNRSIDKDAVETLWSELNEEERGVFKHDPSLIVAEYKKLFEAGGADRLMNMITEKPGQATIELTFVED